MNSKSIYIGSVQGTRDGAREYKEEKGGNLKDYRCRGNYEYYGFEGFFFY